MSDRLEHRDPKQPVCSVPAAAHIKEQPAIPGAPNPDGDEHAVRADGAPAATTRTASPAPASTPRSPVHGPPETSDHAPALAALGPRQQEFLLLLKQGGAGTIPEFAERVELNVETVRHHVQALTKQGLLQRVGTRAAGRGRPEIVYGLTDAAESLFPRREGAVLHALAEHLKATGNEAALESFFDAWIDARRPAALARVEHLRGRARMEEVARILSELGFMAVVDPEAGSALRLCHCPLRELVGATKIPCRAELGFVRELLGGERLTRLSYIPSGDASCTYAPQTAGASSP